MPESIIVCNTHLFWDHRRPDIRVAQINRLIEILQDMASVLEIETTPVVICGDFNDTAISEPCLQLLKPIKITTEEKSTS
jgi:endonuclease/exonuclease/phosphatase family metal-dependent hydrolase